MMAASKRSGGNNSSNKFGLLDVGIGVLVSLALLLTMITYVFPGQVQRVEQEAEREVGQYLNDFGNHNNNHKNHDPDYDSVPSLLENNNNNNMHWVDGEQKLKRELEILAQRQRDGIDVGVPVLTRWLGDDIPAWPTRHADHRRMTEAEWTKRVEEAYAQMRRDEAAWRAEMTRYLESEVAAVG